MLRYYNLSDVVYFFCVIFMIHRLFSCHDSDFKVWHIWKSIAPNGWTRMDCEVVMCHDNMQDLDNVPAPSNKKGKKTGKGKKVAKAAMMYKWSSKALQDFLMNCWRDVSLYFRMFWDGKMQFKIPSQITVESLRLGLRSLTSTSQTELWSHLFAQIFLFSQHESLIQNRHQWPHNCTGHRLAIKSRLSWQYICQWWIPKQALTVFLSHWHAHASIPVFVPLLFRRPEILRVGGFQSTCFPLS